LEETKEELSAKLNELLETDIKFEKLSKEELTQLHEALVKAKEASEFPLPLLDRPLGEILDKKLFNKSLRETTLAEILGLPKERKGLLGLGVLPKILSRLEEVRSEPKASET
jgi:hypothetical protein